MSNRREFLKHAAERGAALQFTDGHEELHQQGMLHGVEVFNGTQHYPGVSDWCNERDLAIFANSDIHSSELNMYGIQNPFRPITLVLATSRCRWEAWCSI